MLTRENIMIKTLLFIIFLTLITFNVNLNAGEYSKYTADYYRAQYSDYLNKTISIKVSHVKPFHFISNIPELRFFHVYTLDDNKNIPGGWIITAIPADKEESFIKKYGTSPDGIGKGRIKNSDSKLLRAVLRSDGKRLIYLDFTGQCEKLMDVRRQEILDKMASAGDPETSESRRPFLRKRLNSTPTTQF